LQENPQWPPEHTGAALPTEVVQGEPHPPQLATSVWVSTQPLLQDVSVPVHPEEHVGGPPFCEAQTGVAEPAAHDTLQEPQWAAVLSCTHAPLQSEYPALHATVHAPLTHAGWPFGRVVHAVQDDPQAVAVLVASTQAWPQRVGALGGHVATHPYVPPEAAHSGVPASGSHARPHCPQFSPVV
jgi:hypothetical protein